MSENKDKRLAKWASIAGIIGVCIAAIALIPAFGSWLMPQDSTQYVPPSDNGSPNTNVEIPTSLPNVSNNPPTVFFNEWVNVDTQSKTIKQVSIQTKDGGTYINMIGSCSPTDCNFREENPTVVVNYNYDSETKILHVEWIFDFQTLTQELTITSDNQLRVKTFVRHTDNSGKADYEMVDYYIRQ